MNITDYKLDESGQQVLVRTVIDNGNGTGLETTYQNGQPTETTEITLDTPANTPQDTIVVSSTIVKDLKDAMSDPSINSIQEIKNAIKTFTDSLLSS